MHFHICADEVNAALAIIPQAHQVVFCSQQAWARFKAWVRANIKAIAR
jgi:hypothetical protein